MRRAFVLMIGGVIMLGATGCVRSTLHLATERPVRLVSATGYALLPVTNAVLGTTRSTPVCQVRDLEANIQAVRADTLMLTQLRHVRVVTGTPACPQHAAYALVLSEHPDVLAKRTERDLGGVILSLIALPIVSLIAFLLIFGDPYGT